MAYYEFIRKYKTINLENANEQYKELGYPHRNIEVLKCSECNKLTLVDESIAYKYCPHCGINIEFIKYNKRG